MELEPADCVEPDWDSLLKRADYRYFTTLKPYGKCAMEIKLNANW